MNDNLSDVKISKYASIKNSLLEKIETGEYPPLYKIPSENEIAEIYNVSVITVRKALSDLTNDGRIFRIKGKGSFVSDGQKTNGAHSKPGLKIIALSVLMYEDSDKSTMQIIRGAQSQLSKSGYSLMVECSHDDIHTEAQILEKCIQNEVDGVLLFSANPDKNASSLKRLRANGIPFVLIDRGVSRLPATLVSSYNIDGTYKATKYLIGLGHRKIAFVSQDSQITTEKDRQQGYRMAVEEANIEYVSGYCIDRISDSLEMLYQMLIDKKPTAIVCVNDKCALMLMDFLKSKGMEIPRDISVTGFDDTEFGKYASTGLTTVKQPFTEIGSVAASKLIELIESNADNHSQVFLPVELIIRDSAASVESNGSGGNIP